MIQAAIAAARRMRIMVDVLRYLWWSGHWWLVPMVAVLLLFGVLMIFAQSTAIAPFIYTMF